MSEEIKKLTQEQIENIKKEMQSQGISEDQIEKYLKHIENTGVITQEKEACEHKLLNKLKEQTYQCMDCEMVIQIVEAMIYRPDGYAQEVYETLKEMEGIDKWKKKYLKSV